MKREIKFRAFVGGEMDYDIAVDNKGNAMYWDNAHGPLSGSFDMPKWDMFINPAVVMQFTGLKDSKGREIYEGDIVKSEWQHDGAINRDYDLVGQIIFGGNDGEPGFFMFHKDGDSYSPMVSFEREELLSIEVIGNVWENPELLEAKP